MKLLQGWMNIEVLLHWWSFLGGNVLLCKITLNVDGIWNSNYNFEWLNFHFSGFRYKEKMQFSVPFSWWEIKDKNRRMTSLFSSFIALFYLKMKDFALSAVNLSILLLKILNYGISIWSRSFFYNMKSVWQIFQLKE